jgi:hypothetical protein
VIQEPDDELDWLDGFAEQHNATATLPLDDPARAAPIPMAPEAEEVDGWLDTLARQDAGVSLGDLGFRHMPAAEAQAMLDLAGKPREAGEALAPEMSDLPLVGYGFTLKDQARALQAQARVQRGKATAEDERLYLGYLVDAARESSTGAGVLDVAWTIATSIPEILGGAAVASGAKAAGKKALRAAGQQMMSEALEKAAAKATERTIGRIALQAAPALVAATGLQEVVSSLAHGEGVLGGGAWTLRSVQTLLGREMTDAEAQEIVDAKNAILPVLLEQGGGLVDGMIRQSITMGAEGAGPLLGKLPIVKQIDLVTGMLFAKLGGKVGAGGWSKAALEIAQQQGMASEGMEELTDNVTEAAAFGDKTIIEAAIEVAEQAPEFAGALALIRGGAATAQRVGAMLPKSGPAPATAPVATEGGGLAQVAPDALAGAEGATAAEAPEIAPEVRAADVEKFGRETGATFRVVEPDTVEEHAAVSFLRRFNVDVTVAEAEEGADLEALPGAFYPGEGRAVVLRGQPQLVAMAVHEGLHTWEAQQTPERRAEFGAALREISPEFMDQVEAFVRTQPLYQNISPELLAEELRTNAATMLGGLTAYLTTPQGKADFELAYGAQPGPFKRALGALYDWIQGQIRLLPQRKRALARARLRVARGGGDPALVAQRVLEALGEIRAVRPPEGAGAAQPVAPNLLSAPTTPPAASETVAPRPPKTPAGRQAARDARRGYGMPGALRQEPRPLSARQDVADFDTQVARERYGMPGMLTRADFRRPDPPPMPGDAALEIEGLDTSFDPADFDESFQRDESEPDAERGPSLYERLAQRTPAERRARPVTLLDHVLDLGGFDLRGTSRKGEGGDVRDRILGMAGRNRSGIPSGLIRTHESTARGKGLRPDDMREALKERGFTGSELDGRIGFDDMLDAVASEVGGGTPMLSAESQDLLEREAMREAGGLSGMDAVRDFISDGKFAPRAPQSVPTGAIGGELPLSIDWFRTLLQDNTIPLRDTPELRTAVKRLRPMLPDRLRRLEQDVRAMLRPFRGVADVEKLSRALYLTAATQRNAWMLADRGVVDGSGISTADAQAELAQIRADLTPARLDPFLAQHAAENQERLDHLVETGIIPAAKAAEWAAREPNWVSMRELDPNADEHLGFGSKSMQVKNPQIRKAEGRAFEAEHSLLAWYTEYATRMAFAEKNRALLVGARAGIPSIPKPRNVPGGFTPPDNYVAYLDNGAQHYLVMAEQLAADTLKGLDGDVTGLITDMFGKATRLFSRNVTGRNPTFWPINFLRDVPMAVIGSFVERDAAYAARVAARAPLALPAMLRYQVTGNTAGLPWIEDAQRHGFKTTWSDRRSMKEQLADFRAMIEGPRGFRAKMRATLRFVEALGDAFEMATRYAVFETETRRQMRAGKTQEEAFQAGADYAREITINFDTKGSLTRHLGSYYAFFNPAVQGSARMMQLALSKRGAGIFGGIVAAGFLMEAANYALAPDDEETGLNMYGSLAEWEKNRNMVLPLWDEDGKATWKITLPYGIDALYGVGRRAFLLASGIDPRQTPSKVVLDGLMHASQSFNPLGDVSDPIAMATPTVLKPIMEIDRNQKFGNRPVMPAAESFGQTKPDSARYFSTLDDRASGWIARHIANVLNLGGPEELPTGLDVSPESVQHILEFFSAGFGLRDLDRLSEFRLSSRDVSPAQTVPILRSFRAAVTSHYVAELYYEIRTTASRLHSMANDPENAERVGDIRARDERAWGLKSLIGRVDRQRSKLKKKLADAEGDEAHRIREEMTALEAQVVGAYYRRDAGDDRARLVGR